MEIGALIKTPKDMWVDFQDAEILIGFLSIDELKEIAKRNTGRTYYSSKGESGFKEKLDSDGAALELGAKAVKDWKGITLKSKPCKFSPEKRDLFMTKWPEFAGFVAATCNDVALFGEKQRVVDEKKS